MDDDWFDGGFTGVVERRLRFSGLLPLSSVFFADGDFIEGDGARLMVVCDGNEAAMLAGETGVNVTLSTLSEDRVRGDFISLSWPIINVLTSNFDRLCDCWLSRRSDLLLEDDDDDVGISEMPGPTPRLLANNSTGFLLNCSNASLNSWSLDFLPDEDDVAVNAAA